MKYTEIDKNRIIILQKTYNPGALHQTDGQTHRQRFTHFYLVPPCTGVKSLRTAPNFKNSYKIQFWSYENPMPGFEEISMSSVSEKWRKNSKGFLNILIIFLRFLDLKLELNFVRIKDNLGRSIYQGGKLNNV